MRELPADKRRATHVLVKGSYLSPGEQVEPGVPAAFHPLPDGAAANRLGFARWLVDRENPLTARVAVNRIWAQLWGAGLVTSEEDFGTQGTPPSHPELLDWLAVDFMRDWDLKRALKKMVTSAAYRQSSAVTPELAVKDPGNRLLARGARFRLEAEMIRDQALSLAGLLSRKMGGPPVYPPQPPALWRFTDLTMADEPGRRSLSSRALHFLAPPGAAPFDGHLRRAEPRSLFAAPPLDEYAAASPGDVERSGLRGGGPVARPARGARRGRERS